MSTGHEPSASVTWNSERGRYDWTVTLPGGKEITGHADTEHQARRDMHNDWHVRGEQPPPLCSACAVDSGPAHANGPYPRRVGPFGWRRRLSKSAVGAASARRRS